MVLIHERTSEHKGNLWEKCEQTASANLSTERSAGNVSRHKTPANAAFSGHSDDRTFAQMRRTVAERSWRSSPNVPCLGLIKRTVVSLYVAGFIRTATAQRMIDATHSWEA